VNPILINTIYRNGDIHASAKRSNLFGMGDGLEGFEKWRTEELGKGRR